MAPTTVKGRSLLKGQSPVPKAPKPRDGPIVKTVAARSRNAVNPDLSAHSRTDPTGALNTLVKLVTSLATRIGGCQYKMTSSEHALSLHLLSILEPFVYQGARSLSMVTNPSSAGRGAISGLAFQPTEILDAIIYHIDAKKDLLSLALCSKRTYDVVFPRHFDYRVVRCKVSSLSVWNHLSVHRSLARNVRRLEILDERSKAPPPRFMSHPTSKNIPRGMGKRDTDFDSTDDEVRARGIHGKHEKYLLAALQRMTGLQELKWSCNHSPISMERVWDTLTVTCPLTLERLDVSNNLIFASMPVSATSGEDSSGEDEAEGTNLMSSPVKTIRFSSMRNAYGAGKLPGLSQIVRILQQSPQLESLTIEYSRPSGSPANNPTTLQLDPLLQSVVNGSRWANLSSLCLRGLLIMATADFAHLLSSHPTLETLRLSDMRGPSRMQLPTNALPRLREIEATKEVINSILDSPCISADGTLRPLEVVKGFNLSGSHNDSLPTPRSPDQTLLDNLARHASTIRRVELSGWHDMDDLRKLAKAVPGLTYLDLGKRLGMSTAQRACPGNAAAPPVTNVEEWLEVLDDFTELRALHGVRFFYEVSALNVPSGPTLMAGMTHFSTTQTNSTSTSTFEPVGSLSAPKQQLSTDQMSLMDRSRMKKNDWTASMLVWRCPKLTRVDHWEANDNKIIALTKVKIGFGGAKESEKVGEGDFGGGGTSRESVTVKWEIRRVRREALW